MYDATPQSTTSRYAAQGGGADPADPNDLANGLISLTLRFLAIVVILGAMANGGIASAGEQRTEAIAASEPVATVELAARAGASFGAHVGQTDTSGWLGAVRRIVIDPGHGGTNEGAVGVGGVHEKHLTLPISMHLADRLRAQYPDAEVILTRYADEDLGLSERVELANAEGADLFISIHLNAALNPRAAGYETYWVADPSPVLPRGVPAHIGLLQILPTFPTLCEERQEAAYRARVFAEHVHGALGSRLDVPDRGVKRGNYTVLRRANVPAVVIELGFLTHAEEGVAVLSPAYQARLVDGLVEAVGNFDNRMVVEAQQAVASK